MSVFTAIGHFFKGIFDMFKLPGSADKVKTVLDEVQRHVPAALNVVQELETLYPNHITEDVIAGAAQLGLHATETMTAMEIETLLQNMALAKLQQVAAGVKNSILRSAISIAVNLWKAHL